MGISLHSGIYACSRARICLVIQAVLGSAFVGLWLIPPAHSVIAVESQIRQDGRYQTLPLLEWDAREGATLRGRLGVTNGSINVASVRIRPVSAVTNANFGVNFNTTGKQKLRAPAPATWIKLNQSEVKLPPKGTRYVPFSIQVPKRLHRGGDYLAGFSVTEANQKPAVGEGKIKLRTIGRFGVGVVIHTPGPRHVSLKFEGVRVLASGQGLEFKIKINNTGNIWIREVTGNFTISHRGRSVVKSTVSPGSILPMDSIEYAIIASDLTGIKAGDALRIVGTLHYAGRDVRLNDVARFGKAEAQEQERLFGEPNLSDKATSPAVIAAALTAMLMLAGGAAYMLRRRRLPFTKGAAHKLLNKVLPAVSPLQPLSIILFAGVLDRKQRKQLLATVRPHLRASDKVADLEADGLLVICGETSSDVAKALAADLSRKAELAENLNIGPLRVETATAQTPVPVATLLEQTRPGP